MLLHIVVNCSNHPEKLDAALIRPGRIDKKLYLGYMQGPEARQMVEHYFQGYVYCSLCLQHTRMNC
jgi:ATP-dependent 26S proteasome regulatory subunit